MRRVVLYSDDDSFLMNRHSSLVDWYMVMALMLIPLPASMLMLTPILPFEKGRRREDLRHRRRHRYRRGRNNPQVLVLVRYLYRQWHVASGSPDDPDAGADSDASIPPFPPVVLAVPVLYSFAQTNGTPHAGIVTVNVEATVAVVVVSIESAAAARKNMNYSSCCSCYYNCCYRCCNDRQWWILCQRKGLFFSLAFASVVDIHVDVNIRDVGLPHNH